MDLVNAVGIMAGFVSTIAIFPQALKVWKTKSTRDISLWTFILYSVNILLWGWYGFLLHSYPLVITEMITGVMTLYILVMKIRSLKDDNELF